MLKKCCALALVLCFFFAYAQALENTLLDDLENLSPEDFAQKYITEDRTGMELFEELQSQLGEYEQWPSEYKLHHEEKRFDIDEKNMILHGENSPAIWHESFGKHEFFEYEEFEPGGIPKVTQEQAEEIALQWAEEKGLLPAETKEKLSLQAILTNRTYHSSYISDMWYVRILAGQEKPIEVWIDASDGMTPQQSAEDVLKRAKEELLNFAKIKEGISYPDEVWFDFPYSEEEIDTWALYPVYYPNDQRWRVFADLLENKENRNFYDVHDGMKFYEMCFEDWGLGFLGMTP